MRVIGRTGADLPSRGVKPSRVRETIRLQSP